VSYSVGESHKINVFGVDWMRDLLWRFQLLIVAISAVISAIMPVQAQLRYEPGDEHIASAVNEGNGYFKASELEIGEQAYTAHPGLRLCFGKYAFADLEIEGWRWNHLPVDDCKMIATQIEQGVFFKEYETGLQRSLVESIDGKASLKEFADSMLFVISKMKAGD